MCCFAHNKTQFAEYKFYSNEFFFCIFNWNSKKIAN